MSMVWVGRSIFYSKNALEIPTIETGSLPSPGFLCLVGVGQWGHRVSMFGDDSEQQVSLTQIRSV
jgi:hypothetical protein